MGKEATAKKAEETTVATVAPMNEVDTTKLAPKLASELNLDALKGFLTDHLKGMGYSTPEITPDLIMTAYRVWPTEQRDPMLRAAGLVPTPGLFSSISGWHNIEHMRSAGWRNKLAGFMGIVYQAAAISFAVYLGVDWYRNQAA